MVMLVSHGGFCCGITHLHLSDIANPLFDVPAMVKWAHENVSVGAVQRETYTNEGLPSGLSYRALYGWSAPAFSMERPAEPAKDRVKALIEAYVKTGRSSGLIEAVLTPKQKDWIPILEELGFKPVAASVNSNTHWTVTMYVLEYGKVAGSGLRDPRVVKGN